MLTLPLTNKQREYLRNCSHRWNVKTGATGSGKSFVDFALTIPKRIRSAKGQGLLAMLGNTKGTLERNILDPMREIWSPDLVGNISSDNTVRIFGKKVYALGADNKKHMARIQGATLEYVYGDEITTWSEEVFQMLKSRLRCEHSHFDGTCNPDNPHHWFKAFLDSDADIYQQNYVIDDGALPTSIVEELKKEYAGTVYYNRFILGQWAAAEGLIYRQFADAPSSYEVEDSPDIRLATIGVDFGGNGSAHAFVCNGITHDWSTVVTLDEYYRKEVISPAQLEEDFVAFVRRCQTRWRVVEVYCDSAEQSLIQGFRVAAHKAGLRVDIKNARKGPINDRIRFWCMLHGAGRYKIAKGCRHLSDAFCEAVWDPRIVGKDVRLDDGRHNVDSLDACEYSMEPFMQDLIRR